MALPLLPSGNDCLKALPAGADCQSPRSGESPARAAPFDRANATSPPPRPLLCLPCDRWRLYVEAIDAIDARGTYWVRPVALLDLADAPSATAADPAIAATAGKLYDARSASDLVWPQLLFRPALDVEVVPVLARLASDAAERAGSGDSPLSTRQAFHAFLRRVWETFPDAFVGDRPARNPRDGSTTGDRQR